VPPCSRVQNVEVTDPDCRMSVPRTEQFILELAVEFLEPLSRVRSPYTLSRLVVFEDRTTYPVLQLLAKRKFGSWSEDLFPFWIDGDYSNETLENVSLAQKERQPRRKLNLPGGPLYRKAWRSANKERIRRYVREAHAREELLRTLSSEG